MSTKVVTKYVAVDRRRLRGEIAISNYCPRSLYFVFRQICEERNLFKQKTLAEAVTEWVDYKFSLPNSEVVTPGYQPRSTKAFNKDDCVQFNFWLKKEIHTKFKVLCTLHSLNFRAALVEAITMWCQSRLGTENQGNLSRSVSSCTKSETEISKKLEDKAPIRSKTPTAKELATK